MWPGQQPPGGEQNPQNNPYRQPGYQQPNPYTQPGYQQPDPYAQQPHWGTPAPAGAPRPPQGGGGNHTKLIAIVSATAVVLAACVTGFLVLGRDKDGKADGGGAGGNAGRSAAADPTTAATATSGADGDPHGDVTEQPLVAGWKTVVNPKWGTAFDVPADWQVGTPRSLVGFEDRKSPDAKPLIAMSAPATYKSKWCTSDGDKDGRSDDTPLAVAGTKGESGARNPGDAAVKSVPWWVYGGYTQPDKKSVTQDEKATDYTTASGVEGAYAWASSTGTPRTGKCASDGKAITFAFRNAADDIVSFNLYAAKGVDGEVGTATIMKILSTVRMHGEPTGS
ncbi:hypothetical protein ACFC09_34875 [Streptomyces sp. NPDC056161]|uniref:hypothetical protein n=1 Tax=Streptomyces sp. NPDC056161 TaxID=3345732 RepID=UPI0035E21D22